MADPVVVPCPKDVWTKVATGINTAIVKILNVRPNIYLETYRANTNPAPANNDGANPIDASRELIVNSSSLVDVYIQPVGADGEVRVDL